MYREEVHSPTYNSAFLKRVHAKRRAEAEAIERKRQREEQERRKQEALRLADEIAAQNAERRRAEADRIAAIIAAHAEELNALAIMERDRDRRMIARIEARALRIFKVTREEFVGKSRTERIVIARQFYAYWTRRLTKFSLPHIGRHAGDRDHTTILSGIRAYPRKRAKSGRTLRSLG